MKARNKVFDFTMIFFLVFSFFLAGPLQSSFFAAGISLLIVCTYSEKRHCMQKLFACDTGKILFFGYLALFPLNLIFCIINNTFDATYFSTFFMQLIKIFCVLIVVSALNVKGKDIVYYEKLFVAIAFIQSVIQLAAFANKPLAQFLFHFNHSAELYEGYGGRRGLALSGGTGWPLAIVFGLSFLFYTKNFIINKAKVHFFDVLIGVVLLLGVLFSGRSAFLGIITSILYFVLSHKTIKNKIAIVFRFVVLLFFSAAFAVGLLFVSARHMVDSFVNGVLPWAFEFFYKKQSTGTLQTGSTNRLLEMWGESRFITEHTILFGDGWFTDPITGAYFHHVDVGYLRNMFYWGIFGTGFLYVFFIALFLPKFLKSRKNDRLFICMLILTMFVLELKAMTVFSSHLPTVLLTFWLFMSEKLEMNERTGGCHA